MTYRRYVTATQHSGTLKEVKRFQGNSEFGSSCVCCLHLFIVWQLATSLLLSEYLQCLSSWALSGLGSLTMFCSQLESAGGSDFDGAGNEQQCTLCHI